LFGIGRDDKDDKNEKNDKNAGDSKDRGRNRDDNEQ
jgi:hypothetical protein